MNINEKESKLKKNFFPLVEVDASVASALEEGICVVDDFRNVRHRRRLSVDTRLTLLDHRAVLGEVAWGKGRIGKGREGEEGQEKEGPGEELEGEEEGEEEEV